MSELVYTVPESTMTVQRNASRDCHVALIVVTCWCSSGPENDSGVIWIPARNTMSKVQFSRIPGTALAMAGCYFADVNTKSWVMMGGATIIQVVCIGSEGDGCQ